MIEEIRPSGREEDDGCTDVGDEPIEQIEEVALGPVNVLDDENGWRDRSNLFDERDRVTVQPLARVEGVQVRRDVEPER